MSKGGEKSGGFFSKLFGSSKKSSNTTTPTNSTATSSTSSAASSTATSPHHLPSPQPSDSLIIIRARSGLLSSPSAAAALAAHTEFRFPSSLAGDKLEGLWHAYQIRTPPHHPETELKTLLGALQQVQQEWREGMERKAWTSHSSSNLAAAATAHRGTNGSSSTPSASPAPTPSPSPPIATPSAAIPSSSSSTTSLSSLPLLHRLHRHHGHPSSFLRRLVQDFTQHTANVLPEQLAQFIHQHTQHSHEPDSPGAPSIHSQAHDHESIHSNGQHQPQQQQQRTLEQHLEHAPMFLLLEIMEHLNLFTNNRYILQHSDFFPWLVKLTQMLTNEYLILPSPSPVSSASETQRQPFFTPSILLHYFHTMLHRCFSMIHVWIDGNETWRRKELYTLGQLSPTSSNHPSSVPNPHAPLPPPMTPLAFPVTPLDQSTLTDTALQLFIHLHPHLIQQLSSRTPQQSTTAAPPMPSFIPPFFPLPLYHSLLHLFGCLSFGQPTQQDIFLQYSLHRRLVEVIGFKFDPIGMNLDDNSHPNDSDHDPSQPPPCFTTRVTLRDGWFQTQVWCLEVLREICFAQVSQCLEFVKNGGMERMLDAILWTYSAYHTTTTANEEGSEAQAINSITQLQAVEAFLTSKFADQQAETEMEERLSREVSIRPGGWMRSVMVMLLNPARNKRCGTVYSSDACVVPPALLLASPQLHAIFNVLLSMCCMDLRAEMAYHPFTTPSPTSPVSASNAKNSKSPIPPPATPPPFNISFLILQMVLDLFNPEINPSPHNQVVRGQIIQLASSTDDQAELYIPFLQLHTIGFFQQLLIYKPQLLNFVRTYNVYHTMFSSSFFFLGQQSFGEEGRAHQEIEGSPMPLSTPKPLTRYEVHQMNISTMMRTCCLDGMNVFATLHAVPHALAIPSSELSYLLSLLYQRYTSTTLVQQVCLTIKHMWQHRRVECEQALLQLCWQAHFYTINVPEIIRPGSAAEQNRPLDPFKIFSKLLSFFHQTVGNAKNVPINPAQTEFLNLLETILFSSLEMQILALRDHSFIWGCFSMVEGHEPKRRRAGIRMTMALVCAVGASADILPSLSTPPTPTTSSHTPQPVIAPPTSPPTPVLPTAPPSTTSRLRSNSTEMDETYGTVSNDVTLLTKKDGHSAVRDGNSLYDHDEVQKVARVVLTKYIELFPNLCTPSLAILIDLIYGLHGLLTRHTHLHQDLCRRRHIFVQLMHILSHLGNANLIVEEEPSLPSVSSNLGLTLPPMSFSAVGSPMGSPGFPSESPNPDVTERVRMGSDLAILDNVRMQSMPGFAYVTPARGASDQMHHVPKLILQRSISDSVVPSSIASPATPSSAMTLLLSLLRCLTLLLSNNVRSKEVFRKNIGNDLLAKLIHKVLQREIGAKTTNETDDLNTSTSHGGGGGGHLIHHDSFHSNDMTPASIASRAIYGEVFRALVESEWAEIVAFEHSALTPIQGMNEPLTLKSDSAAAGRVFLFNMHTATPLLDSILPQLIALQQSLVVNRLDESALRHGFLNTEHSIKQLHKFVYEEGGEILAIFGPSPAAEFLRASSPSPQITVQGTHAEPLIAFLMLARMHEFDAQLADPSVAAFELLPTTKSEWQDFSTHVRNQKRLIRQVAVSGDARRKGAGGLLLRAAKLRYPRGLLTSIIYGPPPYANEPALSFFTANTFHQVGWEIVTSVVPSMANHLPHGYKAQVLTWTYEAESKEAKKPTKSLQPVQILPALIESQHSSSTSLSTSSSISYFPTSDTSFVWIQNSDVIPLLFSPHLFLSAPLHVQRDVITLFTRLVVTSFLNQSHCCKVLLIDLLLDLFPHLPPAHQQSDELVSLQRSFLYLIQIIGTHSISVKQLKRFFSLMKSTPIKVPENWLHVSADQLIETTMVNPDEEDDPPVPEPDQDQDAPSTPKKLKDEMALLESNGSRSPMSPSSPFLATDEGTSLVEVQVRPWYGSLLLGAIEAMTSKSGPDHFWFLDGLSSGLTIPPLDKWPNKAGWGFSAWIRIESYIQPTLPASVRSDASLAEFPGQEQQPGRKSPSPNPLAQHHSNYQPRLFHFSAAPSGRPFVEAYFNHQRHLTIACCMSAGGPIQHQSIDYDLQPQTWYHVCMSQNVAATFGTSELNVYIDGACVHTSSTLKYPSISKQLSFCFVGTNQASNPLGGLSSTNPQPSSSSLGPIQPLYGQLGPFYFFDDVLTPIQVQLMYALGPSYMFTFGPETININAQNKTIGSPGLDTMVTTNAHVPTSPNSSLATPMTPGNASPAAATLVAMTTQLAQYARNLSGKIFLSYNAKARDGHLFLDNTPRAKRLGSNATAGSRKRGMHAVALVGTYQCSTRHVGHVLTCLGGINVLFSTDPHSPHSVLSKSNNPQRKVYWKLDETESSERMRRKLKVNYRGHDHHEAAHDYVPAAKPLTALTPKPGSTTSLVALDASASSSPVKPKFAASGEEDLFAAAILFSKYAKGSLIPEHQDRTRNATTEPEEDWDLLENGGGKKGDKNVKQLLPPVVAGETVFDTDCSFIHFMDVVGGRLRATATHLYFEAHRDEAPVVPGSAAERERERKKRLAKRRGVPLPELNHDHTWLLSHVVALHFRRHQLRRNAIELFFNDHTCIFFVFANETTRNTIHSKLLRALRPFARAQQSRLSTAIGSNAGGLVCPLAHMAFVYAGSSGNYGIGGPWGGNAFDVIRKSGLVTAWRTRKISNFQYLMHLNTIAGRTYNDLTQYPVFPWVLADYTSSSLNLDDPTNASGVFRDLSKPVGALNPTRLQMFLDRYHGLDDPTMPKFMYGTHYSSSGSVLHYLIRLEPFTSAAVELQDGKFDHSDRLFHSIPATWQGVTSNAADVKELIPEFFYLPEMLRNDSGINFGTKQHGEKIGDVILPPWASSAEEFVRIHRQALESEYVSLNLHHWIDLIFGFKQQGRAALEANNVFFHLTYEGGVDIERIEDPTIRDATIAQIEHFGQTPSQLFSTAHPARMTRQQQAEQEIPSLFQMMRDYQLLQAQREQSTNTGSTLGLTMFMGNTASPGGSASTPTSNEPSHLEASRLMLQLYTVEQVTASAATENPILFLALLPGSDRLLSIALDRVMSLHKFKNVIQEYIPPFVLEVDKKRGGVSNESNSSTWSGPSGGMMNLRNNASTIGGTGTSGISGALSFMGSGLSGSSTSSAKRVGVHFTVGLNILPFFFLTSYDERFLLSCGHWDNSFRVTHIESGQGIQAISAHKDIVTCMAISENGEFIVTGSKDTTTIVWQVAEYVLDLPSHPIFVAMGAGGAAVASAAASAAAAGGLYLLDSPYHVLYGHDDEVTCVSVSSDLDTVVSGSRDGTIMVHGLRSGRYTRTISPPDHGAIRWVGISTQGTIISYSLLDLMFHAYTINGAFIGSCDTGERLYCIQFSVDGEFLLCGGDRKQLSLYQLHRSNQQPIACVHRLPHTDGTIRSIVLTKEEQHILVGTGTGKLYVYGLNADYLRKRFLKRLAHLGL